MREGGDPVSTPGSRRSSQSPWDGGRWPSGLELRPFPGKVTVSPGRPTREGVSGWDFPVPEVRKWRAHRVLIRASTCPGPADPQQDPPVCLN